MVGMYRDRKTDIAEVCRRNDGKRALFGNVLQMFQTLHLTVVKILYPLKHS